MIPSPSRGHFRLSCKDFLQLLPCWHLLIFFCLTTTFNRIIPDADHRLGKAFCCHQRFYVCFQLCPLVPSQANYFLCEVISKYSSKELTELLLNEYNILIKDCGTKKAFRNGEYIRIAVRSTLDNQRLIDALKEL